MQVNFSLPVYIVFCTVVIYQHQHQASASSSSPSSLFLSRQGGVDTIPSLFLCSFFWVVSSSVSFSPTSRFSVTISSVYNIQYCSLESILHQESKKRCVFLYDGMSSHKYSYKDVEAAL